MHTCIHLAKVLSSITRHYVFSRLQFLLKMLAAVKSTKTEKQSTRFLDGDKYSFLQSGGVSLLIVRLNFFCYFQ